MTLLFLPFTARADIPVSVKKVSIGTNHACALLTDGTVKCWGGNEYGQLGDGTTTNRKTPVDVEDITHAIDIATSDYRTCTIIADGTVKCWGYNEFGQLGDGTTTNRKTPVAVQGISSATAISCSGADNCVVLQNNTLQCWGSREGVTQSPAPVTGITSATAIAAGGSPCALLADGSVHCWGPNYSGQLGDGTTVDRKTPVAVQGISSATAVGTGSVHACALLADGTVQCWGEGSTGQLGPVTFPDPDEPYRTTPVTVSGISEAIQLETQNSHSCVVISDGRVKCWGFLNEGSLMPRGDCTERNDDSDSDDPVTIAGITSATAVVVGDSYFCATLDSGSVQCWGTLYSTGVDDESSAVIDQCDPEDMKFNELSPPVGRLRLLFLNIGRFLKASIQHI